MLCLKSPISFCAAQVRLSIQCMLLEGISRPVNSPYCNSQFSLPFSCTSVWQINMLTRFSGKYVTAIIQGDSFHSISLPPPPSLSALLSVPVVVCTCINCTSWWYIYLNFGHLCLRFFYFFYYNTTNIQSLSSCPEQAIIVPNHHLPGFCFP